MAGVKPGFFRADDAMEQEAQAYGGGVIIRPAQVAAILNSTKVNMRANSPDPFDEVDYGYAGRIPQANKPVPFQYVQQDGYKGLLPWEILPQIPERDPWE